jgi:hypothetical protein
MAIFMVAIALVATISPGIALAANGPPQPVDDPVTTAEDSPTSGNVLTNDGNNGDGPLEVTGFGPLAPSIGTLNVEADGDFTFTPAADWNGSTSTTYTVYNGKHSRPGNILITVTPVQDAPDADDDTVTIDEDAATDATAAILANDSDVDGDTLSVSDVSNAAGGTVDLSAGVVTFTPTVDLCGDGAGSFDYDISDGNGGSDSASVTIDITCLNEAPVADEDTVMVDEDTPTDVTAEILANDNDANSDTLSVSAVSNATGGTVDLTAGVVTFTPTADLCGDGEGGFDYDISDGNGGSDSASVSVDITCANDGPAAGDDTVDVTEDTPTDVTAELLANDSDVDGDTLSVSDVSNATGGGIDLSGGVVTFTPDANLCGDGEGSFDYDISDGNSGSDSASVTVDITCANDVPAAGNDTVDVTEDTATDVTAQILANDTDVEGDTLAVSDVSNATGGTVDLTAGVVTFTPTANLCGDGEGSFEYDVSDGNGGTDSGTVSVDITCVNDAPVAVDDTGNVAGGSGATDFDVLANDTDIDTAHGSLTVFSASVSASAGSASVVGGKVRFTPLGSFNGDAVITYAVSDGALQDTGTLTVTVGTDATPPVVTAPTVHFDSGRVNETAPLLISWSATDAGSGIASYEVQVSAGGKAFTTIYTGAGTSVRRQFPFKTSLVFRVRATDGANNVSPWATADSRRIVAYQRSSTSLSFSGTWTVVASTSSSGTDYLHTTTLGNRAALTFTGREVLYVAPMTSASGHAKVTVGGTLIGRFNLRSASTRYGRIIAKVVWGTNGAHTIRVTNDQAGRRTNLDAFVVLK